MNSEKFDYGGDDDSSAPESGTRNELDGIFGPSDTKPQRPPSRPRVGLDLRVTVQVVIAVILLAVAGGLLARDAWARRARDNAYRQMIEANASREYLRVIQAGENFLTHQPLNGSRDTREGSVVSLYTEALVHWVAQQPGKLDVNAHKHITRYKQLVRNPDK